MSNQTSENNKRIAKNTLVLYVRMLFLMCICKRSIFRLDKPCPLDYLCAKNFKAKSYGKRKSKLSGGL